MALPYFFMEELGAEGGDIRLNEETSKHITGVLRMKAGEQIHLTDCAGNLLLAGITTADKKKCTVNVLNRQFIPRVERKTVIGISLLKNTGRLEWFLEKATELGITGIIPLVCHRTEKHHFRTERMKSILVSAMLQSQQVWLPELHEPVGFGQLFRLEEINLMQQKFIAHCLPDQKSALHQLSDPKASSQIILIGPEGDFSGEEIALALSHQFAAVSLGHTRLRSETAGVVAAALLCV